MVRQEQVAAISSKGLQGIDGLVGGEVARQVLPPVSDADAVAHHPAHGVLFDVQLVDGSRCEHNALASIHISALEPSDSVLLVGALLIVVGHEHSHLLVGRRTDIAEAVGRELLQLILFLVLSADVPLVGSKTYGEDAACERGRRVEVDDTSAAVVDDVVPSAEHVAVGEVFPSLHDVGIGSEAIGIEVPHAVVVALHACTDEGVDAALIETADVVHTPIDIVAAVVVDLALGVTDDGLRAPDVGVLTTLAIAEDAGSISISNTAYGYGELRGVVRQEEVAAILAESLESIDGLG